MDQMLLLVSTLFLLTAKIKHWSSIGGSVGAALAWTVNFEFAGGLLTNFPLYALEYRDEQLIPIK